MGTLTVATIHATSSITAVFRMKHHPLQNEECPCLLYAMDTIRKLKLKQVTFEGAKLELFEDILIALAEGSSATLKRLSLKDFSHIAGLSTIERFVGIEYLAFHNVCLKTVDSRVQAIKTLNELKLEMCDLGNDSIAFSTLY